MVPITPIPYLPRPPGGARRAALAHALALAGAAAALIFGGSRHATTHRDPRLRRG